MRYYKLIIIAILILITVACINKDKPNWMEDAQDNTEEEVEATHNHKQSKHIDEIKANELYRWQIDT